MSSLWTNLLFMHGHITDLDLARRLAAAPEPDKRVSGKRQRTPKADVATKKISAAPAAVAHGSCA